MQIAKSNPSLKVLDLRHFSGSYDREENIGELILGSLQSSNIDTITDLNLSHNDSWFLDPSTMEEKSGVDLLAEILTKQLGLLHLNLDYNHLSSSATLKILSRIAAQGSNS